MTNFNSATRSFDLCSEGTQSYAWAWENLDRAQCLAEIKETDNDIVAYAHGWAEELCSRSIDQINPEGERGFTKEEIVYDLVNDRHALARALEAWLGGDDEDGGDEPQDEDDEPQPIGVEVAIRLVEEGFIHERAGIYINRANGYSGCYDISSDIDHYDLYEVVWGDAIASSVGRLGRNEVVALIREEAKLGATFYWQTLPNNQWELTNAPELPAGFIEEKELLLEDRAEMFPPRNTANVAQPVAPTREGFFICTRSIEGRGQTPATMIYAFGGEADFYRQNPDWVGELPAPRWFGVIVMDTTQPVEGGFQLAWGGAHDCAIHAPYIYKP